MISHRPQLAPAAARIGRVLFRLFLQQGVRSLFDYSTIMRHSTGAPDLKMRKEERPCSAEITYGVRYGGVSRGRRVSIKSCIHAAVAARSLSPICPQPIRAIFLSLTIHSTLSIRHFQGFSKTCRRWSNASAPTSMAGLKHIPRCALDGAFPGRKLSRLQECSRWQSKMLVSCA